MTQRTKVKLAKGWLALVIIFLITVAWMFPKVGIALGIGIVTGVVLVVSAKSGMTLMDYIDDTKGKWW